MTYTSSYIADLKERSVGDAVVVTGQYLRRRDHRDRVTITVRDITGIIFVALYDEQIEKLNKIEKLSRIRVWGKTSRSKDGASVVIPTADHLSDMGSLKVPYRDLGVEMREYASRLYVSRITQQCASVFRDLQFDEFESKVISSECVDEGLEPLQVLFPGFGNPATLITSPNAQVMDFINATGVDKAFTISISFTSTFRHLNNAAETRVLLAKAVDLPFLGLRNLALSISLKIIERLQVSPTNPPYEEDLEAPWPSFRVEGSKSHTLKLAEYGQDVEKGGTSWRNMLLERVIHIISPAGLVLVDAASERIGERTISTLAVYPARFLSLIDAPPPRRQLNDLNEYTSWHA